MRLSEPAKAIFEEFFRKTGLCKESEFPDVRIYVGLGARMLTGILLAEGITVGRAIYVSPRWVRRSSSGRMIVSKHLLVHELVHVFQYRTDGAARFISRFIVELVRGIREKRDWTLSGVYESYMSIPHEVEARKYAYEFKCWLKLRNT